MPTMADPSPCSSRGKLVRLALAAVLSTPFAWSFHRCHGWRRKLLRAFGASWHPAIRTRCTNRIECLWNLVVGMDTAIGGGAIVHRLSAVCIGNHSMISW